MLEMMKKKWKMSGQNAGWLMAMLVMAGCAAAGAVLAAAVGLGSFAWTAGSIGMVGGGLASMLFLLNE